MLLSIMKANTPLGDVSIFEYQIYPSKQRGDVNSYTGAH